MPRPPLRLAALALLLAAATARGDELNAERAAALDRISADSLKGHLSFLASDLLEGRATPSKGLDIAAEYIAAQFRRAGLEPIGDDGYFQTAKWTVRGPDPASFALSVTIGDEPFPVGAGWVSLAAGGKLDVKAKGLYKLDPADPASYEKLTAEQLDGKAVLAALPDTTSLERSKRAAATQAEAKFLTAMRERKVALVLAVSRDPKAATGLGRGRLVDPEGGGGGFSLRAGPGNPPRVTVHLPRLVERFDALPTGPVEGSAVLKLGEPVDRPVILKNVVGLLRGSDPKLKDTYVLVTAHYDHIGIGSPVDGDAIYNGANDDGSGTVSVVELASALGSLKERPKRSLVFITFFGEELGLVGSRYYGRHPVVPIEKTVADVNLEQVGRTDSTEGDQTGKASLTGFDFSEMGAVFQAAGKAEGIDVFKHPRNSDMYFGASDNQSLADQGVPAHTLCVAYQYSDYHGAHDHWDKVNYAHMARIDRLVARSLLMLADREAPPKWNADNSKAARYLKAWQKLHPE